MIYKTWQISDHLPGINGRIDGTGGRAPGGGIAWVGGGPVGNGAANKSV